MALHAIRHSRWPMGLTPAWCFEGALKSMPTGKELPIARRSDNDTDVSKGTCKLAKLS